MSKLKQKETKKAKLKLRKAASHYLERVDGRLMAKGYFMIEVLFNGKWMKAGDENGMFKFRTEEERDMKLKELREDAK